LLSLSLAKILSDCEINNLHSFLKSLIWYDCCLWFGLLARSLHSRRRLLIENLALRQQLAVLKRGHPKPRLGLVDKLFWVLASRLWSDWKKSLLVVTPENRGPLASGWVSTVLESDLEGEKTGR
jgi:hypothetical protein